MFKIPITIGVEKSIELLISFFTFDIIFTLYLMSTKTDSTMNETILEYDSIIKKCEDIFAKKMKDYGSAWRILRISSLTDQIFIKAQRIRSIESKGIQKIDEGVINEFIGIVNYSVIGLIQIDLGVSEQPEDLEFEKVMNMFNKHVLSSKDLMVNKNHDYGEAWRDMRVSSLTDLILQKLLRVKQIEDNNGSTIISEGIDANYLDMLNYAVFALIKLNK
tara:strand:- start:3134 stop:3790 length:657 start_codon:yes stop_codon:yes gene_type:complete